MFKVLQHINTYMVDVYDVQSENIVGVKFRVTVNHSNKTISWDTDYSLSDYEKMNLISSLNQTDIQRRINTEYQFKDDFKKQTLAFLKDLSDTPLGMGLIVLVAAPLFLPSMLLKQLFRKKG